ncbi:hypothetical protein BRYFOR_06769 [Marvinbryantia formatexigens DSM 14469]|uniref:NfeD-like C-terminal domain-containing protein n=1 Tax=Marvinbryantia formatexigens DSM 14469 TaxID=478749 RepID=C6LDS0_9FIRM|nr:NfeD family protein [Marvinbryantia formatexigens]EET61124.1 hypothetical protein BRYFOR_06769 [Marvinbryantia formatexigens DSM 14469]UWO23701.1 NfeD family protein [Marvinbryantia formatexigens DSM 14469]SDF66984.1 Membrane protein implicated in regulation of membrane protease activity [Marvinbryantia formatexigens]
MEPIYWLILFALLLVIEVLTMGLTTVWFAGGAIAAMVVCMLGGNIWLQCGVFLAVSFALLVFTRPFAVRYVNRKRERTNADGLIGQNACVTETIDNLQSTGRAQVRGQEWTARSADDRQIIKAGSTVQIAAIEGVKLIVKEKEKTT